jgi:hypothetical protein
MTPTQGWAQLGVLGCLAHGQDSAEKGAKLLSVGSLCES